MSDKKPTFNAGIMNAFLSGAGNVLKTMCFVNPVASKPLIKKDKKAVGELTNMISGDSRKRLSALGMNFEAGLPTVITGKNHEIESGMLSGAQTISIPFVVGAGYKFSVEFTFE